MSSEIPYSFIRDVDLTANPIKVSLTISHTIQIGNEFYKPVATLQVPVSDPEKIPEAFSAIFSDCSSVVQKITDGVRAQYHGKSQ